MSKLPEIQSEYIEPYLAQYFGYLIESIAMGFKTPQEAKNELKGVENFVSQFCGIHARYATMNEYHRINEMPDAELLDLCKRIFASSTNN